jgi:hypothetical protein
MNNENPYLDVISARLAERSRLFHVASVAHLEASRELYTQGLRGEHHASISAAYSRESLRLDEQLRILIRQYPNMSITASNDLGILTGDNNTTNTTQLASSNSDIDLIQAFKVIELAL